MACTMSQIPHSTVASVPPYMDSQSPMTGGTSQPGSAHSSPQAIQLSPCSSQGERRPSRAQKGKRVHGCEYPGCGKVFTRAEHRRRHELIHKSKKLHACPREGCTKAFNRADYLAQHIARHGHESPRKSSPTKSSQLPLSPAPSAQKSHCAANGPPASYGFQTPFITAHATVPSGTEQPILHLPQYLSSQYPSQEGMPRSSIDSYPAGMDHDSFATVGLGITTEPATPSISTTGLNTVVDHQYLQSVLRPEAFLAPSHPPEHVATSVWNSGIDPNLPQTVPAGFQNPVTCTSWPTFSDTVLPEERSPQHLPGTLSPPPDWQ